LPAAPISPSSGCGSLDLARVEPELTDFALPEEAGPPGAAPLPQELAPLLTGRPEGPVGAGASRQELAANSQLREAVFQQVVHAGRLAKSRGRDTVVLRLTPPQLGEVTLRLVHGPEGVTARFVAGLPEARGIIEGNLPRLEQALAGQGLQLQQAGVYADGRQSPAPRPRVVPARIRGFKLEVQPAYAVSLAATGLDMTM
jgi:flagellar hook-length control protein FliK